VIRYEQGSAQQHSTVPPVKVVGAWVILGALGGLLRSPANPPKTKPSSNVAGHMAQSSRIMCWRCGAHVHACSKGVAKVGVAFILFLIIYIWITPIITTVSFTLCLLFFWLKINHLSCNDCVFIPMFGVAANR
jgi:hypothetical protein